MLLLELVEEVVDERNVEVLTTKVSVTVGGLHLEHTLLHLQDGDIEGTAAKIVHCHDGRTRLVEAICEGGCRRLGDDA